MVKKKGKWFVSENNPHVSEEAKKNIQDVLDVFHDSDDTVYSFTPTLSKAERGMVHVLCRKMGMISKSSGKGDQRHVVVSKPGRKVSRTSKISAENKPAEICPFAFSEESRRVLMNLFMHYPPIEDQNVEQRLNDQTGNNLSSEGRRDDIFLRPRMSKAEVAKQVESLANRVNKTPKLKEISRKRSQLPIASFQHCITSTVTNHQVVLICGETGCGKTTQVPQYLLDYMWARGEACKIVCTQPRRISAISVSERVCQERGEQIGASVGYKIRLEARGGRRTSILFCTSGILLRVLVSSKDSSSGASDMKSENRISELTHIVVDEIHERDRYSDFMLTILRDLLPAYPHLRLVLMSATIDAERFSQYFGGCPIIRVPGFTHPVKSFYLEEVLSILKTPKRDHLNANTSPACQKEELKFSEEYQVALDEAIDMSCSNEDFDSLRELISSEKMPKALNCQHSSTGVTPLMVFAGKGKVEDVCTLLSLGADPRLQACDGSNALEWAKRANQTQVTEMLKQHMQAVLSGSTKEEEQLIKKYMDNINPEVIDYVLIIQLLKKVCIESKNGAILVFLPGWEEINRTQRTMLENSFFADSSRFLVLPLHSMVPSADQKKVFQRPPKGCRKIILSTNIAETSVTIDDVVYVIDTGRMKEKGYDPYNNVSTLKSSWISKASAKQREGRAGRCQPGVCYHLFSKLKAVSLADFQEPEIKRMPIEELCLQVKMLDPNCKVDDFLKKTLDPPVLETINNAIAVLQDIGALSHNEQLTELGKKLSTLPVHPVTSKMLFSSILLNCLDPALTLACTADYREPFNLPMLPSDKNRADAARAKLALLYGGYSDQLSIVAAFECWKSAKERGLESWFCSEFFVSSNIMHMLSGMRLQLLNELKRCGFVPSDASACSLNARNPGIVRGVLMAGLYPRVGKLHLPVKVGKSFFVETGSSKKAQLLNRSLIAKVPCDELFDENDEGPLLLYDEVTQGDGGLHIRKCTVIGPLPLLLFSKELAVVSGEKNTDDPAEKKCENDSPANGDNQGSPKTGSMNNTNEQEEKILKSPDDSVTVVVDGWLSFKTTALEVAQIYCLRERLSAAILFKISNPGRVLPPPLESSINAVAHLLAYDGMSGTSLPPIEVKPTVDILTSLSKADEIAEDLAEKRKKRSKGLADSSKSSRDKPEPLIIKVITPPQKSLATEPALVNPTSMPVQVDSNVRSPEKPATCNPVQEISPPQDIPTSDPMMVPVQVASKKRKRKSKSKKKVVQGESKPPGQATVEQPTVTTATKEGLPITGAKFVKPPSVQTTINKKRKRKGKSKSKVQDSQPGLAVLPPVLSAVERLTSGPVLTSTPSAPVKEARAPKPGLAALIGYDSSPFGPYGPRGR